MLFSHKVAVCTSVALLVSLMVPSGGAAAGSGEAVDAHGPQAQDDAADEGAHPQVPQPPV